MKEGMGVRIPPLALMNTKKQGDVGLGEAIRYFTSKGYTVCIPLTDSQDYDLVVDYDGALARVQVKHTTYKRYCNYGVSLTVKGGNRSAAGRIKTFDNTKIDYLFVITTDNKYCIPARAIVEKHNISLGEKFSQYICL